MDEGLKAITTFANVSSCVVVMLNRFAHVTLGLNRANIELLNQNITLTVKSSNCSVYSRGFAWF